MALWVAWGGRVRYRAAHDWAGHHRWPVGRRDLPRSSGQDRRSEGGIVLDVAQLLFLDSSAIHCFIKTCQVTGRRVVLRNATPAVRLVLELADAKAEPDSWMFDASW